jgi:hypothetical protein
MLRVKLDGGAKIRQRADAVALPAEQLAAGIEDIGQRGIEPERIAVVGDGAIEIWSLR